MARLFTKIGIALAVLGALIGITAKIRNTRKETKQSGFAKHVQNLRKTAQRS